MKRLCVLCCSYIIALTAWGQPDVVFGQGNGGRSSGQSYTRNYSNHSNNSDSKYNAPPIVQNIYYKHKSGVAVSLRIWKKRKYTSGDSRIDNYLENLARSTYGEDSGWGFELSPGWLVSMGTKLQINNAYFELKQVQRGITTIIRVARDLSWVSGYDSMTGVEMQFTQRASKQEYDKWCEVHNKLYNQIQYGGGGNSYSSSSSSGRSSSRGSSTTGNSVCPDCNGKGYRPQSYTYAAGSSFAPYHNYGGTSCYICGQATDHYHYRCTTCRRR